MIQHSSRVPLALLLAVATSGCFGAFDTGPQGKSQTGGSYSPGGGSSAGGGSTSPGGGSSGSGYVPGGSGGSGGSGASGGSGGSGTIPGGGSPGTTTPGELPCTVDAHCADMAVLDDCHAPICDSATGTCAVAWRPDGAPCEDGDICTGGETCWRGACGGSDLMLDCDDGDACTHDYCVPSSGCVWEPEPACAAPTGPCCEPHGGLGCTSPAIEACVCAVDSYCCTTSWDEQCATQVETFGCAACIVVTPAPSCYGACGGESPDGCWCDATCAQYGDCCEDVCVECPGSCGSDCFVAADVPGCEDWECEDCVCASDAYCCDVAWDATCVESIDPLGCPCW